MKRFYDATTEYHVCDCCGVKLMDGELERTSMSLSIRVGEDVEYEWWNKGEYCGSCSDALFGAIYDGIPVPERCDKHFRDSDVEKAIEVAIIKRKRGLEEPECLTSSEVMST